MIGDPTAHPPLRQLPFAKLFIFPNHLPALLPPHPLSVILVSLNAGMDSDTTAYVKEKSLFSALNYLFGAAHQHSQKTHTNYTL